MFCNNCGKDNKDGMKFCTQCGSKLEKVLNSEKSVDETLEYVNNINYENSSSVINNGLNNKKNDHTALIIIIVISIVVTIIGISVFIIWKANSNRINNNNNVYDNNTINTDTSNNTNNNVIPNVDNNNIDDSFTTDNSINNNDKIVTNFDNYNIDVDMTMEVSGMSVKSKMSGTVDEKNQIEYLKMSMDMLGMSFNIESYSDFKNGVTYTYEPFSGEWSKETGANKTLDLNNLLNTLKSMQNVVKIDDNHFKVKINNNEIMGMLDDSDIDFSNITGDILADIFTNDGNIEKIKYDFSNLTDEFGEFSMEINISNYNKAGSVTIPDDVISSATEY